MLEFVCQEPVFEKRVGSRKPRLIYDAFQWRNLTCSTQLQAPLPSKRIRNSHVSFEDALCSIQSAILQFSSLAVSGTKYTRWKNEVNCLGCSKATSWKMSHNKFVWHAVELLHWFILKSLLIFFFWDLNHGQFWNCLQGVVDRCY